MTDPDSPKIPDSISFKELSNFLRDKPSLPLSTVIPELDLGGPIGGVCDLQFAIMQLIQRSAKGCNILQLLSAAIHLLTEVEFHFAEQINRVDAELPPFDKTSEEDRKEVITTLRGLILSLRTANGLNEELFTGLMHNFGIRRIQAIRDQITGVITPEEFRSHLLISDELLDGLQLQRDPVTEYLDRAANTF